MNYGDFSATADAEETALPCERGNRNWHVFRFDKNSKDVK